jgi:hypothetical protein
MSDESKAPEGWAPVAGSEWLEALHCRYPDEDRDVIVSIHAKEPGYEVRERTGSSASGPSETTMGVRESLGAARELMIKTCRDWDGWMVRRHTLGCS